MKLRLPKSLLLIACSCIAVAYGTESNRFIDVGTTDSYTYNKWKLDFTSSLPSVAGIYVCPENEMVDGKLLLSGTDKVGTYNEKGNFFTVSDTDKYTFIGKATITSNKVTTNETVGTVTKNFQVKGTLEITENAQVSLGGHYYAEVEASIQTLGINTTFKHAEYTGLIADNVIVKGYDGNVSLNTQTIDVNNLTVESGTVKIHTSNSEGNTSLSIKEPGTAKAMDSKQSQIYDTLTVKGTADVTIGKAGGYTNQTDVHCATSFGRLTVENPTILDGTFMGADGYDIDGVQITQYDDSSKLTVAGRSVSVGGLNIDQHGGTMSISAGTNEYHFLADYGDSIITQRGDNSELTIGCIKAYNSYYDYVVKALEDSNLDYAIDPSISITQYDSGSIYLNGVDFRNQKDTSIGSAQHSTINQEGAGVIKLDGEYQGVTFDIAQNGGGKINLNSNIKAGSVKQTGTGTVTVAKGKKLTANSIVVDNGATFVNNGIVEIEATEPALLPAAEGDVATEADDMLKLTITGGQVQNYGTFIGDILVDGGILELAAGQVNGAITMDDGAIKVMSSSSITSLEVSGGTITFEQGAVLTLTGDTTVDLTNATVFVNVSADFLAGLEIGETVTLFDSDTSTIEFNNTLVTFVNGGDTVQTLVSGSQTGGSIKVEAVVPEPTTATLSLLALAALAARRRRR